MAVLDDDTVDAVDVLVPSAHHREYVVAALERGKHVFVETPMALTIRDADAMIQAARTHRPLRLLYPQTHVQESLFRSLLNLHKFVVHEK